MTTYITRLDAGGRGLRLAVKDLIDIEGVPTTAGSRAVADQAEPAAADAPCLAGARAAGAVIVGKTNLNELAFGASGRNEHYGTPVNPVDPALLPSPSGYLSVLGAPGLTAYVGLTEIGALQPGDTVWWVVRVPKFSVVEPAAGLTEAAPS